jgi:hypothetical protein
MKKIILAALTLILTACSFTASRAYEQNLSKWQDAKINHYRYSLSVGCFCAFREEMPVTVEVLDGEIVSITSVKGTLIDSTDPSYSTIEYYATIDRLFSQLKSALDEADEVATTYDPIYGFPTSISIDQIKQAVDDELFITVDHFEILK